MRAVRVVVAGRQVDVALDAVALAAHDQRDLAVGLEADEAVDDVHAGVLQRARPLDVGGLVEAGLELDDRRDLLAVLGGADQRADDRRVGAGAVERLLDGEHVGIVGRLGDELDHVLERLVRVLQQDVALGDDPEDVVVLLQRRHDLRRERLVAELAQVVARRRSAPGRRGAAARRTGRRRRARGAAPSAGSSTTSAGVSCAISSRTALPRSRRRSSFWMVLRRSSASSSSIDRSKLRVTRKALQPSDAEAGEEIAHVHRDQVLEQHEREARGRRAGGRRSPRAAPTRAAGADGTSVMRGSTDGTCTTATIVSRRPTFSLLAVHEHRQVEAAVAQHRERVPGIDRQRRQHRPDLAREVGGQVRLLLGRRAGRRASSRMPRLREPGRDVLAPGAVLLRHHRVRAGADGRELLGGGQPVGRRLGDVARQLLLEAGDADHEELVQVRRDDGQELEALGERHRRVARLLEHPFVEPQPGQLAVDEQLRVRRIVDDRRLADDRLTRPTSHAGSLAQVL